MATNKAAYLMSKQERPLQVKEAPMPTATGSTVIIRNRAISLNPVDWWMQNLGLIIQSYPYILGCDTAGEIVAVGPDVKNHKVGDRVTAWPILDKPGDGPPGGNVHPDAGTFQLYVKAEEAGIAVIPDSLPFTEACVIPLVLGTAASAMFQQDALGLPLPKVVPEDKGEAILIWGGSTSVGSFAIQMARAAGLEVVTTSRPHNFEYCKSLGATQVFDYSSDTVVDDVVSALKGKKMAGVMDAWSRNDGPKLCSNIILKLGIKKFLQTVIPTGMDIAGVPEGIEIGRAYATTINDTEVGPALWGDWIPKALAAGTLKCKPDPLVVGKGLEACQAALDRGAAGVSAQKVVVEL